MGCSALPSPAGPVESPIATVIETDSLRSPLPPSPAIPTSTLTFTPRPSATPTTPPAPTPTPTETETPTITPTLTPDLPRVRVTQQAHCRYGPAKAYLHAADLYPGDQGFARGRFQYSGWLYVQFDKLHYSCWVAPSVIEVVGEVSALPYFPVRLPGPSVLYKPPKNVQATRNGEWVTITWQKVKMTADDDRGYFLELFVCQGGRLLWWPVSLPAQDDTSYTVKDEAGCPAPSGGNLYAVEKHGYTTPVLIPWPPAGR